MALEDFASVVQAGTFAIHVKALGSSFLRLKDSKNFTAIVKRMDEQEIPVLLLESGENPNDMDWRSVKRLPDDTDLSRGDFVIFPADGDRNTQRYRIRSVHTDETGELALYKNAVMTLDPQVG